MQFKQWLILSESVETNLENWLKTWSAYLEKNDPDTMSQVKETIESILENLAKQTMLKMALTNTKVTGKKHDNQNYLRYLVGYATTKPNFRIEDLQRALDAVDWMLQTNKLTNTQAGTIGWYKVGKNASEYIKEKQAAGIEAAQPSNTQIRKMKKAGEAFDELTPVVKEGEFTLYLIKGVDSENKAEVSRKHMLLCKYGKDTDWCTADPTGTYHEDYAKNNIFILYKNGKPAYQFADTQQSVDDDTLQFKDTKDDDIFVVDLLTFNFLLKHNQKELIFYTLIPDLSEDGATKINDEFKRLIYKNYGKWFNDEYLFANNDWGNQHKMARKTIRLITKNMNDFETLYGYLTNSDDLEDGTDELLEINPKFIKYLNKLDISAD